MKVQKLGSLPLGNRDHNLFFFLGRIFAMWFFPFFCEMKKMVVDF